MTVLCPAGIDVILGLLASDEGVPPAKYRVFVADDRYIAAQCVLLRSINCDVIAVHSVERLTFNEFHTRSHSGHFAYVLLPNLRHRVASCGANRNGSAFTMLCTILGIWRLHLRTPFMVVVTI